LSSQSAVLLLGERPDYFIQMLEELYKMTLRDFDVLRLCGQGPLCPWQCHKSMRESMKHLEERAFVTWVFPHQRWEISIAGRAYLDCILLSLEDYTPAVKGNAPVLQFPSVKTYP